MDLTSYQQWLSNFYRQRGWYDYDPFIRCNFLAEEVGELAQAVRKKEIGRDRPGEQHTSDLENLEHIREELGNALDNVFILADKYHISLQDIMLAHKNKLEKRFGSQ